MYLSFYKLKEKPFSINTDPRFLWYGEKHGEALANLTYGLSEGNGYVVLTGDAGTGKTTLVNALLETLDDNVLVAKINHPTFGADEFLNLVAKTYDSTVETASKSDCLFFFQSFLQRTHAEGKTALLIIDEAHCLPKESLEEIRLLSNMEQAHKKLINIFLAGQEELKLTLFSPECRALRQRITLFYDIHPLSEVETLNYVVHRLKVAGTEEQVFTAGAIHQIQNFTQGYPRLINIICDRAMLTGYLKEQKEINAEIVSECAHEISFLDPAEFITETIKIDQSSRQEPRTVAGWSTQKVDRNNSTQEEPTAVRLSDRAKKVTNDAYQKATSSLVKKTRQNVIAIGLVAAIALVAFVVGIGVKTRTNVKPAESRQVDQTAPEETADNPARRAALAVPQQPSDHADSVSESKQVDRTAPEETAGNPARRAALAAPQQPTDHADSVSESKQVDQTAPEETADNPARRAALAVPQQPTDHTDSVSETPVPDVPEAPPKMLKQPPDKEIIDHTKKDAPANPKPAVAESPSLGKTSSSETKPDLQSKSAPAGSAALTPKKSTKAFQPTTLDLATAALKQQNYKTAIELLEADRSLDARNSKKAKELYSTALVGRAGQIMKKSPSEAEAMLRKAVEADPENVRAHFNLGKIYTQTKEYALAIAAYQNAVALNPNLSDAFFNLGFIYATTGKYKEAESVFTRVVQLKPTYLDKALFNLAVVQERLGKKQASLANLKEAVAVKPENQKVQAYLKRVEGSAKESP